MHGGPNRLRHRATRFNCTPATRSVDGAIPVVCREPALLVSPRKDNDVRAASGPFAGSKLEPGATLAGLALEIARSTGHSRPIASPPSRTITTSSHPPAPAQLRPAGEFEPLKCQAIQWIRAHRSARLPIAAGQRTADRGGDRVPYVGRRVRIDGRHDLSGVASRCTICPDNDSTRAISSVGQSARITPVRSGVRAPHRPLSMNHAER